ncbi:ABC transporter substrate-binding protein [Streptomyces nojiriensis]|uniref:ABC transporter substrate-binding protein n=1 Tax=Streptomyces nojiriensis TaxID=66374 RepID=UPI0035DFD1A9
MAAEEPGVEPQDREAIEAYEGAQAAFTEKLNLLHISGGSPSYATVASASVRPRLTTTGLNEMLTGKRLPSLEALLEFVRIVTTPSSLDKPAAEKFRADPGLVEEWRGHWQDVKLAQRRAQWASRRRQTTGRQAHDDTAPPVAPPVALPVEPDPNGSAAPSQDGSPADPPAGSGTPPQEPEAPVHGPEGQAQTQAGSPAADPAGGSGAAAPSDPPAPAQGSAEPERFGRGRPSWLTRRLIVVTALVSASALIGGGAWWYVEDGKGKDAAKHAHERQLEEQERKAHCGTGNPALTTTPDGCAGITDGSDGPGIFGPGLEPALTVLDAENTATEKTGGYVTVALMGPLTQGPGSLTGDRAVHQIEGALIAVRKANEGNAYPRIRLVLANMGSDETHWPGVVDQLKKMTGTPGAPGTPGPLVAVTGMGLSQQESIDAARALSAASVPMVGDVITADGFDTTGSIDAGARIEGLVRVAPNSSAQLQAIGQELRKRPELKTAALVSAPTTPAGTPDFYSNSIEKAAQNPATGLLPYLQAGGISFNFDVRGGAAQTSLGTISKNLCGKVTPDVVIYAGRATFLPTFLEKLHQRQCRTTPITVVTGSDAATLDRKLPALNDPEAPISILYVPLADPGQLGDKTNPDHSLYQEFADDFGRDHHGQRFDPGHLASGWAVMAHDSLVTATLAIRNAVDPPQKPPTVYAVRAQLYLFATTNVIEGAGGIFRIDPQTGNRISTHTPQVVRLGPPSP